MNQLYSSLDKAGLMFKRFTDQDEETFILLETTKNGTTEVDINTFEVIFEDVKGNPTYEALSGAHTFILEETQHTMTAEEMGYQKYFDQWKELGLINS